MHTTFYREYAFDFYLSCSALVNSSSLGKVTFAYIIGGHVVTFADATVTGTDRPILGGISM